jgi:hypothetical protein
VRELAATDRRRRSPPTQIGAYFVLADHTTTIAGRIPEAAATRVQKQPIADG